MSRLIDADALVDYLEEYELQENPHFDGNGNEDAYNAIQNCIDAVCEAPTVDPVRHGKPIKHIEPYPNGDEWSQASDSSGAKYYYVWFTCEICGEVIEEHDNYCKHCGARMDGEQDDQI